MRRAGDPTRQNRNDSCGGWTGDSSWFRPTQGRVPNRSHFQPQLVLNACRFASGSDATLWCFDPYVRNDKSCHRCSNASLLCPTSQSGLEGRGIGDVLPRHDASHGCGLRQNPFGVPVEHCAESRWTRRHCVGVGSTRHIAIGRIPRH